MDPTSVEYFKDDPDCTSFLQDKAQLWKNTEKLSDLVGNAKKFDVIFFVGGHGRTCLLNNQQPPVSGLISIAMFDLATLPASHDIVREMHTAERVIVAVCHGPAALAKVKLDNGSYLIANSAVTGFANAEEVALGFENDMPFSLEDVLSENSGGGFQKAKENLAPWVVVAQDGRLMTGQNPASSKPLAEAVLKKLMSK